MGGDLVRKGVPEVVTLELTSAKQTSLWTEKLGGPQSMGSHTVGQD